MQKIIPFLWYKDMLAEEAVNFYVSVIKGARITRITRVGKAEKVQCGWLTDKYGVSWQIVTPLLLEMLNDKDAAKSERVMRAMMQMTKIEIAPLKKAYAG